MLYIPDKTPHPGAGPRLQPLQVDMLWAHWVQVLAPPLTSGVILGESLTCSVPLDAKREMGIIIVPT